MSINYDKVAILFSGKAFCLVFNLKSWGRNWDIRFSYDSSTKRYCATSTKYRRFFFHHKLANYSYNKGFKKRADEIGDSYLLRNIVFNAEDLVIDCGANVGDLLLYFNERAIGIRYVGFEPSPLEYQCLEENVKPHKAINAGLWNAAGHLTFYVSSEGADSSFVQPPRYDRTVEIPVHRLDQLNIINGNIKLLKLEAEGAEPEVIEGCENIIKNIQYISADLGPERGVNQESTLVPVINYLMARNFEIVDLNISRQVVLFKNKMQLTKLSNSA
jgi:FkbM family methyltransferase